MTFRINRVYTRSGDSGETGLVGGRRVRKTDARVAAYGDIDELNAVLGLIKEEVGEGDIRRLLEYLQQELFDLGSQLATPPEDRYPGMWEVTAAHVTTLENLCDRFGEDLPELTSFVLPGGSRASAMFHLGRTVARRAERSVLRLQERGVHEISSEVIQYVNRLSDLLFVFSRWILREEGKDAPLWVQEKHRRLPAAFAPSSEPRTPSSVRTAPAGAADKDE